MRLTALDPVGAVVTGVAPAALTPDDVRALRHRLADHGVLVLPGQVLDDQQFLDLLRRFGRPTFTAGETPVTGFPDLNVISNVGRTTPPRSVFHTDTSYVTHPPTYTALRAVQVPREGGETLFTNQYRAFETLPPDIVELLRGRTIRHTLPGGPTGGGNGGTGADHPVFRTHPVSGRTALYLTTPERCTGISGLEQPTADDLIRALYAHSTTPDNTLRHPWSADDLVLWDNGVVLHRADHGGVVGDRVMHRGMVVA